MESEIKNIKVEITSNVSHDKGLPKYATAGSAGMDFYANVATIIKPGARKLIPTGVKIALPEGYELQIRPRSGLAFKHGITVLNTPGTIDAKNIPL